MKNSMNTNISYPYLAFVALFSTLSVLNNTSALAQSRDEIRFGVEAEVPPFESRNADGELVGLNIELGNALCEEMRVRCTWVDQPYATNIAALQEGRFDVIMPMTPTDARRQIIDFTDVMYELSSRLVARKGSNLSPTAASLKGKRIGVLSGTSRAAFAKAKWESEGVEIVSFGLNAELIESLLAGDIDATLQDTIEISGALLDKPEGSDFDFTGEVVADPALGSGIAMAIRQDEPELKAMLNRALAAIKANGKHEAIVSRYLTSDPSPAGEAGSDRASLEYIGNGGNLPFSQAVRVGNMLYLSGVLGDDANGVFPETTAGQTAAIMDNIGATLERNGSSLDEVVRCNVILADIADFQEMNRVYAGYFPEGRFPARTTFEASNLVAGGKIEIECTAYVR
ncbi:transporter substrate-binding domain-containing protein [Nitratireductor thuwali]|uniref:Histidine-binding periplasmic protein n=1 Tax=Nitratireductor thuwali TaxID=2267699 RepID=A0ABY5MMU1_9HYPH|nr:Histidine-binding periplasmic protein [Nitratireductor thuwali]